MFIPDPVTPLWVRAVVDPAFRDAVIEDPLLALGGAVGSWCSPEQAEELEALDRDERTELVMGVVRAVLMRSRQVRRGQIGIDDPLGGRG